MLIQKLFGASLKPDVVSTLISIINDDIPVASRQLNVKLLMTEFSIRLHFSSASDAMVQENYKSFMIE